MEISKQLIALASFAFGLLAAGLFFSSGIGLSGLVISEPSNNLETIPAPSSTISDSDIDLFTNKLIINIPNASVISYEDSGSMLPLLTNSSHGIRIKPKSQFDIKIGDIISFNIENMTVVHRIVEISSDEKGIYYITRGDNSPKKDDLKLRYEDIEWKLIGVLY